MSNDGARKKAEQRQLSTRAFTSELGTGGAPAMSFRTDSGHFSESLQSLLTPETAITRDCAQGDALASLVL